MSEQLMDLYDFKMRVINGVRVYYKNFPTSPCIHIRLVITTGAFDDPIGKEGLSHFFEHLVFAGSPSLSDKKSIRDWKKKYTLNSWNAATSYSYTKYWLRCLPDYYSEVLRGMKDLIFYPYLRSEDLEEERKVILQEAWGKYENEKYLKHCKEVISNSFRGHAHERISSALGWPDTIEKISHEDITKWHKEKYGVGNFFIVLSGAVEEEHVDAWNNIIEGLHVFENIETDFGSVNAPKINRIEKEAEEIGKNIEQAEFVISRVLPSSCIEEGYCLNVFGKLLQDILYERFRIEQSLCYGVSVGVQNSKTYSTVYMEIKADEKNVSIIEEVFKNVLKEIEEGLHGGRFVTIKSLYVEQILSREEIASGVVDVVFNEIIIYGKPITTSEELRCLDLVSYGDMVRLSKDVFDEKYAVTEIVLPTRNK